MKHLSFINKLNIINIIYVIFWGLISFMSTFYGVWFMNWNVILEGDLVHDLYTPLFLWIAAFFGEYLYILLSIKKETQILDEKWTKVSYGLVEILFLLFFFSSISPNKYRIVFIVFLFFCMMGLKTSSLYVLCPRQRIQSV